MSFRIYKDKTEGVTTKQAIQVKPGDVELWNQKVTKLQNSVSKQNKLLVLSGVTDISATFDNKEFSPSGDVMKYMISIINKMKSKQMTITTNYKYEYSYDLSSVEFKQVNDKLQIDLYQDKLNLESMTENTSATALNDTVGLFSRSFTPQQTSALMSRVTTYATNNVKSNEAIRLKAIESTKSDLISLCTKFGVDSYIINIVPDGLLTNNKVAASNIKYTMTNK